MRRPRKGVAMRCIFCLNEREPSIEHIFPDAIGGTWLSIVCASRVTTGWGQTSTRS